ncbi:glycosyltransferase family 4 protein, partial [bacterium]|nr:glycosyltransferase family 4 protein [bacterium]
MAESNKTNIKSVNKVQTNQVIGIDIRKINDFGIGTYIRNLLFGLAESNELQNVVFRLYSENHSNQKTIKLSPSRFPIVPIPIKRRSPLQGSLPGSINLNVFHAPHYLTPDPGKTSLILTVHDCIHLSPPPLPGAFERMGNTTDHIFDAAKRLYHRGQGILRFKKLVKHATAIITVSDATTQHLVDLTGVDSSKIIRIYNCVNKMFYKSPSNENTEDFCGKYGLQKHKYFLYCGNDLYHKNLAGLLTAWKNLSLLQDPPVLVLTGPPRQLMIREYTESLGITDKIVLLDRIPASNLPYLYHGAQALIMPSLAEGFGLPVAEAMVMQIPVVCSDIPVLREITGEHALFFDPYSPGSIVAAVKRFLNEPEQNTKKTVAA